mmetsp:Transcript_63308/g.70883  ORF Transcript_63308/g.70883 Transcript_63308/m.70883 type:complete len:94 (+) Transcript_63308:831-1112(+)
MNKTRCMVTQADMESVNFSCIFSSYSNMLADDGSGRLNSIVEAMPSNINPRPRGKLARELKISPMNCKSFGELNRKKDERQMIAIPHAVRSAI